MASRPRAPFRLLHHSRPASPWNGPTARPASRSDLRKTDRSRSRSRTCRYTPRRRWHHRINGRIAGTTGTSSKRPVGTACKRKLLAETRIGLNSTAKRTCSLEAATLRKGFCVKFEDKPPVHRLSSLQERYGRHCIRQGGGRDPAQGDQECPYIFQETYFPEVSASSLHTYHASDAGHGFLSEFLVRHLCALREPYRKPTRTPGTPSGMRLDHLGGRGKRRPGYHRESRGKRHTDAEYRHSRNLENTV